MVARLAVGQTHQLYDMTESTPLGRCPSGLDVRIVRVCTDHEYP
jgi:hypothetical protein